MVKCQIFGIDKKYFGSSSHNHCHLYQKSLISIIAANSNDKNDVPDDDERLKTSKSMIAKFLYERIKKGKNIFLISSSTSFNNLGVSVLSK